MTTSGRRILYLIGSTDPGGAERVVVDLARTLGGGGDEILVGHLGNDWLAEALRGVGIPELRLPFSGLYHSHLTEGLFVLKLARFLRERRIDLVHAHLFGMILYASAAGRLTRTPVVGTIHDKYYLAERAHRRWAYWLCRQLGCDLVAVSEDIRSALVDNSRLAYSDVHVIHNGTDLSLVSSRSRELRREFGFADDEIVITAVGRLAEVKGQSLLIRASRAIANANDRARFLIVGDGPDETLLKELSRTEGAPDQTTFTGHRDDVPELLAMSDIFVQTSLSEGLSCTIIEALGAGLPAVVTDVGGNSEIITNQREGFLVPSGDAVQFAARVLELANDESLRQRLGVTGRETARQRFSLQTMIDSYEQLFVPSDEPLS